MSPGTALPGAVRPMASASSATVSVLRESLLRLEGASDATTESRERRSCRWRCYAAAFEGGSPDADARIRRWTGCLRSALFR